MISLDFNQLKKQAENIKEYCLNPNVMAMNNFRQDDLESMYEKVIIYIDTMQKISELPPSLNKERLMMAQDELLINYICEVNAQFAYILTPNLETIASIQGTATILAEHLMPEENQNHRTKGESEELDFNKLKKQAEGIRGYFLYPAVMDRQDYQCSDIEALYEKLIDYINAMQGISELSFSRKDEFILEQVALIVKYINKFEQQFKAIETEDREALCNIIDGGIILANYSIKPEKDSDFDITREWRKW